MSISETNHAQPFQNKSDHAELFLLVDRYGAAGIASELFDIAKLLAHLSAENGELARAEAELGISAIWEEAHTKLVEMEKKIERLRAAVEEDQD
jgi:hypothetical protein